MVKIAALNRLRNGLKDPDSMQTRSTRVPSGKAYLCGEVNSKNGFGGMTGFKGFIAGPVDSVPLAIQGETMDDAEFRKAWSELC